MQIHHGNILQFQYTKKDYPSTLKDSLIRIGCNFPILVIKENDQLIVCDGHKRLSALYDLYLEDEHHIRCHKIPYVLKHSRSKDAEHISNHH